MTNPTADHGPDPAAADRRTFLSLASSAAMAGGLVAGYGVFAGMAVQFLYPSHGRKLGWVYVADAASVPVGQVFAFRTPSGQTVTIRRQGQAGGVDDFQALSSTCPHLGCQVHWEAQNHRFFCPCHNGVFDPAGKPVAGPPAEAGQSLPAYPIRIEDGLIFIEVPLEPLG